MRVILNESEESLFLVEIWMDLIGSASYSDLKRPIVTHSDLINPTSTKKIRVVAKATTLHFEF